jgi:hypothetical protein
VSDPEVPIEILPQKELGVHVYWQLSTDDWDKPKYFVVADSGAKRPLHGKYRFTLKYSLRPWTILSTSAGPAYTTVSPEFLLIN